jgi:TonB family protein
MKYIAAIFAAALTAGCVSPQPVAPYVESPPTPGTCVGFKPPYAAVTRVDPVYPPEAARIRQTGWVVVDFDIAADGSTTNIRVIDSSPHGVFEAAVVDPLRRWKFEPNQPRTNCRFDLHFNLN